MFTEYMEILTTKYLYKMKSENLNIRKKLSLEEKCEVISNSTINDLIKANVNKKVNIRKYSKVNTL